MTTKNPTVSIGLPVYNGEKHVARALDSLLAQDFSDFEIIICDNASTDATAEICRSYKASDQRIRFHRNPTNLGLAGNFNRTFALARGEFFKWAAHDDWHSPASLRLTVEALRRHEDAVVCASGVSIVNEHGDEIDRWMPTADFEHPDPSVRMRRLLSTLGETHPMYGLLRASALEQTSLVQSYVGSDRTLLAQLSLLGPIVQVPKILHFYTVSAVARRNYRPSLHYDPANRGKLPIRTWRLIFKHLEVVRSSDLPIGKKLVLTGSVLDRFGVRDFRRLAAETYHTGRILTSRAVAWRP